MLFAMFTFVYSLQPQRQEDGLPFVQPASMSVGTPNAPNQVVTIFYYIGKKFSSLITYCNNYLRRFYWKPGLPLDINPLVTREQSTYKMNTKTGNFCSHWTSFLTFNVEEILLQNRFINNNRFCNKLIHSFVCRL